MSLGKDKDEKKGSGKKDKKSHQDKDPQPSLEVPATATSGKETTDEKATTPSSGPQLQYKCVKCRQVVFTSKDLTTHALGATKTVFKVGEEGLCTSFHFVTAPDGRDIHKRLALQVRGGNAECVHCGSKLGKFCPAEGICPCGAIIPGPVVKVNANKLDVHDASLETKDLVQRSKIEIEEVQRENERKDQEILENYQNSAGRVKKAKKHKSENRGNFSNFRNKSFIPNASKAGKKEEVGEVAEGGEDEDDLSEHSDDN
jgi:DNA-directed RNA polymerase subunit RPC12/RpoP